MAVEATTEVHLHIIVSVVVAQAHVRAKIDQWPACCAAGAVTHELPQGLLLIGSPACMATTSRTSASSLGSPITGGAGGLNWAALSRNSGATCCQCGEKTARRKAPTGRSSSKMLGLPAVDVVHARGLVHGHVVGVIP